MSRSGESYVSVVNFWPYLEDARIPAFRSDSCLAKRYDRLPRHVAPPRLAPCKRI
jgi:hypothetical protein